MSQGSVIPPISQQQPQHENQPHPPQQPPCACSTCGMWEQGCANKDGSDCGLKPANDAAPPVISPTSIPSVHNCQGIDAACSSQESVAYPMPSNSFVATLANSLLANILETIQNSAMTPDQNATNPSSTTTSQSQPSAPQITTSDVSCPSTTTASGNSSSHNQGTLPLAEVQNITDKGVVMSTAPPQKGFVRVDDLLSKPGSRVKPCNSPNLVFGSLNPTQKPITNNTVQEPMNCITKVTTSAAVNPNSFLASEKENVSTASAYRCSDMGPSNGEKSPKRQRIC